MPFGIFKKKPDSPKSANSHYRELVVREVVRETPDAVSLIFEQPSTPIQYRSGQFLTLILELEGKEIRRAYSLSSSPSTDAFPAVTVKRVTNGLVSGYIVEKAKAGDKIRVMEPAGHFTVDFASEPARHLMLFAGGSGITPMLSLIKTLLATELKSRCTLVYSNRNIESIIFRKKLDELAQVHQDRFRLYYLLDEANEEWNGFRGFLNAESLNKIFSEITWSDHQSVSYMMCGPEGMMKNVEALLTARGIPADQIRHESFNLTSTDSKPILSNEGASAHPVVIRYDGQEYRVVVESGKTILETALSQGIDLPYSCQSGLCTACRGKALSGKVKLDEEDGLSKSELEEGYVLTCVGRPLTDDVVIEIG